MTYEDILTYFPGGHQRSPDQYECCCPAHDDRKASLGIGRGDRRGVVICCQAGCATIDVLAAIGLRMADLAPPSSNGSRPQFSQSYRYDDENGNEVATKHRKQNKEFLWQQASGEWNLKGVTLPLFGVPELLKSEPGSLVCIAEGEKDVLSLRRHGCVATCNAHGASKSDTPKWTSRETDWLKEHLLGHEFLIFADFDEAGMKHADVIYHALTQAGLDARQASLPGLQKGEDVSDWLPKHTDLEFALVLKRPEEPYVASVASVAVAESLQNGSGGPYVASVASVAVAESLRKPPATLEPEALFGLPGEIVRAIDPHTESHPAAVLANLITGMGCLIGRSPHLYRDGGRQTVNEFAVLVGRSATARKGTATRRVEELLRRVGSGSTNNTSQHDIFDAHDMHEGEEESVYDLLRLSGLGSGEAMVEALADKDSDRRRIVVEEEFARCLKAMRREGSTLSDTIRQAWDGTPLANRTKGKQYRSARHHVAMMGHVTEAELKLEMGDVSIYNGFANRFLWIFCERTKFLPRGGGKVRMAPLVQKLQAVWSFSQNLGEVEFSDEVMEAWDAGGIYALLNAERSGLMGALTARAAAHVTRLALFWMCMDLEAEVMPPHLLAALAVWEFSVKTCEYLFGTSTGDAVADRIEEALIEVFPGTLDRTQIRDLFHRHARPGVVPGALALLTAQQKAVSRRLETPGRPTELWSYRPASDRDQSDESDKSPLERARELFSSTASDRDQSDESDKSPLGLAAADLG